MMAVFKAGLLYTTLVFVIGFILGTLRVLVVTPRIGSVAAVLLEIPLLLTASWIIAGALIKRYAITARWRSRVTMGLIAFAALMALEISLAAFGFGRSVPDQLAAMTRPDGAIGLFGQFLFACVPMLRMYRTERG